MFVGDKGDELVSDLRQISTDDLVFLERYCVRGRTS